MTTTLRLLVIFWSLLATMHTAEKQTPTVCLNMIVKDETPVIRRCLESVLPIIDTWVIVDTGSTDGTQKMIQEFMDEKKVPGKLYERPWKNFAANRNEALEFAKENADYILFIDADEYLSFSPDFTLPYLDKDFYHISINLNKQLQYPRIQLVSTKREWKWQGVLHEVLQHSVDMSYEHLKGIEITSTYDGARARDPKKFEKDAAVLEQALLEEPNNARYVFYLAQSYRDANMAEMAIKNYERRIAMGGWEEEIFWSKFQIGTLKERVQAPKEEVVRAYKEAYLYRPTRAEPLYHLASYLRRMNDFRGCYDIAEVGRTIPVPKDVLFIYSWMYDYGLLFEASIAAYWIGDYRACKDLSLQLLSSEKTPEHIRDCAVRNLGFANARLVETMLLPVAQ